MTGFIPPYPHRPSKELGPLDTLKAVRRDLLSIWPEQSFSHKFSSTKILNRWIFIASSPETVKHVLVTQNSKYEKKSLLMRKALEPLLGNGLFISDGDIWHKHRAIETPLFGPKQVAKYADIMIKTTEERVREWSAIPAGATLDVLPQMGQLTAEIICLSLFGKHLGAKQATQIMQSFADYQAAIEQMDIATFFALPNWIPGLKLGKAHKSAKRIHDIVDNAIAKAANSANDHTLMGRLLSQLDDSGSGSMTAVQIRNELIVLFMAGHDPTANTLAWAWYLISQCPEVEQRLHQEVDSVLASRSAIFADYEKLVYTRAIIDETLRLYPPFPLLAREAIEEDQIGKRGIPKGSVMIVAPWLLHRHKLYWDKPDHFIPERFLPDAPVKPDKFVYIPYSAGPRVCLAKFFGSVEATLCLAILARHFRLTLPKGERVSHECRLTLRPKNNLPMQIVPR